MPIRPIHSTRARLLAAAAPLAGLLAAASPARAELPKFTCLDVKIVKAQSGYYREYDVKEGLATKKFDGFVNRKDLKPTSKCLFPDIKPGQRVAIWFDKKTHDAATKGASMFSGMQCIYLDDGKELALGDEASTDGIAGKDILTKCPNETGYECDAGSNSDRNSKYRADLDKAGQVLRSFFIRPNDNMDSRDSRDGKNDGREVFCQAFDKKSGKVLFATTFKVGPAAPATQN